MTKDYLPSKKFLKFILIFVLLGALVVFAFGKLSKKSSFEGKKSNFVVSDASPTEVDSDGDGLLDWEEALWQTDPFSVDTDEDGVNDKKEVDEKKKALESENEFSEADFTTETAQLAQKIYTVASVLGSSGSQDAISENYVDLVLNDFDNFISQDVIPDKYALGDLRLTNISATKYHQELTSLYNRISGRAVSDAIIFQYIGEDNSVIDSDIDALSAYYKDFSDEFLKMEVPFAIAGAHLSITNTLFKLSIAVQGIKSIDEDPVVSLRSFKNFEIYSNELDLAFAQLTNYLIDNVIIQ